MGEKYFNLKRQLEQLGYKKAFPPDALPLVECLTADLIQTTRSLQHYMETAQDALSQRDELIHQAEPYKCDNARLLSENNYLNKQILHLKEEQQKLLKDDMRKIKSLKDEIANKEEALIKLKQQCRDVGLRGSVPTNTLSSRSRLKNTDSKSGKDCTCSTREVVALESKLTELQKENRDLKEHIESYNDDFVLLQKKIENRDEEIERLNILLEGGRPLSAVMNDCGDVDIGHKVSKLYKEYKKLEEENTSLVKQLEESVEKQHEAMLRALNLADKNKVLEDELSKLDKLALRVEDECNNQIKTKNNENLYLRDQIAELLSRNDQLQLQLAARRNNSIEKLDNSVAEIHEIKEYLATALKEKDEFLLQIKSLESLNTSLQEKLSLALSRVNSVRSEPNQLIASNLATKDDLKDLLEKEKQGYECTSLPLQKRIADALEDFNKNFNNVQKSNKKFDPDFVNELYHKISEVERKVVDLEKENIHLREYPFNSEHVDDQLAELRAINSHLKKENIMLTNSLHYQTQGTSTADEIALEKSKNTILKLNSEIERLISKNNMLKNEKKEHMAQYKEALDSIDKLKKELMQRNSPVENLEERGNLRINSRSGRSSADYVRDESHLLRSQLMKMQEDLIREKTLVAQMKNAQSELDRNANELQDELLRTKKHLAIARENCSMLENKFQDMQAEILSLRMVRSKLLEDLQKTDQEKNNTVTEVTKKSEIVHALEHELKCKSFTIEQLENEVAALKQTMNLNSATEQKLKEKELQIQFSNSEISRLKELYDQALNEIERLQKSLSTTTGSLKAAKLDQQKLQKDAEGLRVQLQHYVAEVKRIEDMLSHKEAERTDMLENFASLSVEANLLENTNHSLLNETASKSTLIQNFRRKIEDLEKRLLAKEQAIDSQSEHMNVLCCKSSTLENEIRLLTEEKSVLEKNNAHLKEMCQKLDSEKKLMGQGIQSTDSELQLYERKIKKLSEAKSQLEVEYFQMKAKIQSVENLLSVSRREVIDLKLALQDATTETKILKDTVNKLSKEVVGTCDLTVGDSDRISRVIDIEDNIKLLRETEALEERYSRSEAIQKRFTKYSHGSTL